eukprot:1144303_1
MAAMDSNSLIMLGKVINVEVADVLDKHPKTWNEGEVAVWLGRVENGEYVRYKNAFIENEVDGNELYELNENVLKEQRYGIRKVTHQKGIAQAIQQLLNSWDKNDDDIEEMEDNDVPYLVHSYNNPLIACVAIAKYNASYDDLNTANDIKMYTEVFEGKYKYKVITNDPSKPMNPQDLTTFLGSVRGQHLYDFGRLKLNYDSLIVTFGGHGTYDSVICSDGTKFKHKSIRDVFKVD